MKQIPIWTSDLHNALVAATTLKHTDFPIALNFDVYLHVDDATYQQIEGDTFLADQIFGGVSEEYKWTIAEMAALATEIDWDVGAALKTREKGEKEFQEQALGLLETAKTRMLAHSRQAIRNWQSEQKDRRTTMAGGQDPEPAENLRSPPNDANLPDLGRKLSRMLDKQEQLDRIIEEEIAKSQFSGDDTSPELFRLTEERKRLEHSVRDLLNDLA